MNHDVKKWKLNDIVEVIADWYDANGRSLPWRADCDPYHIWVSEIMLQQTRIEAVIPYYERFMKELPSIQELAACEDEKLHKLWEGLGYYSRVRNLKKAATLICEEHNGCFPTDFETIRRLPGIGDYTAGAIASMAFHQPHAAVDGNVLRVMSRLMACDTDIMDMHFRKEVTAALSDAYPCGKEASVTQGLMELGEVICIPNGEPDCANCPVNGTCKACIMGIQNSLPIRKPKAKRRIEEKTVFCLVDAENRIALHRRAENGLLAGLWEYPNLLGDTDMADVVTRLSEEVFGCCLPKQYEVTDGGWKKHVFTHVEWHMHCFMVVGTFPENSDLTFVSEKERRTNYALPTAFRKLF